MCSCSEIEFSAYNELQTVVNKGRDSGASTLVLCFTKAAALLGRDTEENQHVLISRCLEGYSRQPECPRRVAASCLRPFGVHCTYLHTYCLFH
ncbi:hypothetical protein Y032_0108g55 [Ancylostoma ceylanicum]|uniref:Uncharacterized protein n=1 Tax=Ancylostoma ceylanicum TaxID=53326 RepID=A0A016TFF7_9BILA|nr:hypothetical protein Y032_0108g55 [Ancylostoma ceylanicum]